VHDWLVQGRDLDGTARLIAANGRVAAHTNMNLVGALVITPVGASSRILPHVETSAPIVVIVADGILPQLLFVDDHSHPARRQGLENMHDAATRLCQPDGHSKLLPVHEMRECDMDTVHRTHCELHICDGQSTHSKRAALFVLNVVKELHAA
jgi:hypothetical protein